MLVARFIYKILKQKEGDENGSQKGRAVVEKLTFGLWGSLVVLPSSLPSIFGLPSAPIDPSPDAPKAPLPRKRDYLIICFSNDIHKQTPN